MEDMHIHLKNAINDQKLFNKYIEKCLEKNLTQVVFLDHGNRISPKHQAVLASHKTIDEFNNKIDNYNKLNNKLKVLKGIEIDYSKDNDFRNETMNILNYKEFEVVIGSIHSMKFNTLDEYLECVLDMIENYKINIIGHIKLDETYKKQKDIIVKILKKCNKKNIKIEINTSDRSRWNDEQLYFMLELMKKYNVSYVFSSDAHSVDEIGYKIESMMEKVRVWKIKK